MISVQATPRSESEGINVFERYTNSARRSLFFARAAAIELGSSVIAPEHLLTAVLRELRKPTPTSNHDWSSVVVSVRVDAELR